MEPQSWNVKAVKRSRSESSGDSEDEWLDDTWYTYSTNTESYHPLDENSLRLLNDDSYDVPETSPDIDDDSIENSPESAHSVDVFSVKSSPESLDNDDVYSIDSSPRSNKLEIKLENTDNKHIAIKKEKPDCVFDRENASSQTDKVSKMNWIKTIKQKKYDNLSTIIPRTSLSPGANILSYRDIISANSANKRTHIVTVLIPSSETESITEALILLGTQNLGLNTDQWTVVDDNCNKLAYTGQIVAFAIDQTSFVALCARNFTANMGFKKLNFRMKKHVQAP